MKRIFVLGVFGVFLVSGCTQEHKVEHTLECVISSVIYNKTGKTVNFKREDAIKNGYEYYFSVYDNGTLIVNDVDVYVKDEEVERSYSLQREKRIDTNMKFQFSKAFDDVKFFILNNDIT